MKKKCLLLIFLLVLTTGCKTINNTGIEQILSTVLKQKSNLSNVVFDGYKYYVPRGIKFSNKEEYNATLIDEYNQIYYLYVDVISFYNNEQLDYKENKKAYFSKKLQYQDKQGYLEITKVGTKDDYFLEYMYNYGKIEAYVKKDNIEEVLIQTSSILSSLQFNRTILETIIGNKVLNYREETYDVMKPKGNIATESYLDYEEKYGTYEGYSPRENDEDEIKIEED